MTRTLAIDGMHCRSCVERLTAAFRDIPGVVAASVSLSPPRARVETDRLVPFEKFSLAAREAGAYSVRESEDAAPAPGPQPGVGVRPSLYPLWLIVIYITGTAGLTAFFRGGLHAFLNDFMAGFFLVFSFFKLLDLRGFADAYISYDILARRWRPWAFLYPFIELALGVAYLVRWQPVFVNALTLGLMLIGSVGVLRALMRKDAIRCACLGTRLNLPMTTVTLVEDLAMAAMALLMLLRA